MPSINTNEKQKIYLDNCCFNRPYDNQSFLKIELETKAKLRIQELIIDGKYELVISYILEYENDDNPYVERKIAIEEFFKHATINIDETDEILSIADEAKATGLKTKDALHVACAIAANCDYLITTDDRFLKYRNNRIQIISPIDFIFRQEEF